MTPVVLRADPSRLALRLPLFGLGVLAAGAAAGVAAGARHSVNLFVVSVLAFGCLRFWASRTRLVFDDSGIAMATPLSTWREPWTGIASIGVTTFLTPTHRGGVGAGVTLRMADGAMRSIPDVFSVRREDLARELAQRRASTARR